MINTDVLSPAGRARSRTGCEGSGNKKSRAKTLLVRRSGRSVKGERNLYLKGFLLVSGREGDIQIPIHQFPQFLTRFKKGHPFSGDIHPITGFWVPPDTCVSVSDSKTSKSPQLNLFSLRQRLGNTLKDCINYNLRLLFGQVDLRRNLSTNSALVIKYVSPLKKFGGSISLTPSKSSVLRIQAGI